MFLRVPAMKEFCKALYSKYCMNESSFTEEDYHRTVEDMLFNCRDVDRLRLNLPFQLVGRHCNAATMILANTFKAFANRPEEDSAKLKVLVLENVTDVAVCHLWMNPVDVMNIMRVVDKLEHLVMTIRRHENEVHRSRWFGSCLWNLVENAGQLQSLCLWGVENDDRLPRGLKQTKFWQTGADEWRARALPAPHIMMPQLTSLELKKVDITPSVLIKAAENFGPTLQELYLNEVYLKTEQLDGFNESQVLWVGRPNQRPGDGQRWLAMELRCAAPQLRICRASFLGYDFYIREEVSTHPEFDLIDPCGLGRSISQRFVETVTGIQQPNMPSGDPVEYLPADPRKDHLMRQLSARTKPLSVEEYDTNAYQEAVENTTSLWQQSIDDLFPNCNSNTLDELHYIAETACQGMSEIHGRGIREWNANNRANNSTGVPALPVGEEDLQLDVAQDALDDEDDLLLDDEDDLLLDDEGDLLLDDECCDHDHLDHEHSIHEPLNHEHANHQLPNHENL